MRKLFQPLNLAHGRWNTIHRAAQRSDDPVQRCATAAHAPHDGPDVRTALGSLAQRLRTRARGARTEARRSYWTHYARAPPRRERAVRSEVRASVRVPLRMARNGCARLRKERAGLSN